MAGGFGLAVWTIAANLPPGSGYGSVRSSISAVLGAGNFPYVFAACTGVALVAWLACAWLGEIVSRVPARRLRRALSPLLWGASLPALSLLLDAVCFWPTAAPLVALGTGLGLLTAGRELVRSAAPDRSVVDEHGRGAIATAAVGLPLCLLVLGWSPPSGDEPHYLIVSHSLAYDFDLDLADDYRERVYAPFHPTALSPHYRPGLREGSRYSMHGVGLSILLAPAYALGRTWEPQGPGAMVALPRLTLVLLYGLFAWVLYGFVEEVATASAARWGTAATVLPAPLLFAPLAVFAEVPAMLLSLWVFRAVYRPTGGSAAHGLALAALPFVGVKYIPLAAALLVVGAATADSGGRANRLLRLGLPLAAGLALHALFTWRLYGSLSPAAIYLGAGDQAGAPALGGNWAAYVAAWPAALATAIGYFLDQKEGLLAYGPHFLLAFSGLAALAARRRRTLVALALVAAAYVGPYALSQQLGGQGPPVRPLMAVLWTLTPAIGVALAGPASAAWDALRGGLLGLSAALTVAYAAQPELLPHDYPVVASRLLQQYSPYGSSWWRLFPQWVNVDFPNPAVTAVWTIAVGTLAVALWRQGSRSGEPPAAEDSVATSLRAGWITAAVLFTVACGFVLVHHAVIVRTDRHRPTQMGSGLVAWVPEQLPPVAFPESGGVWAIPGEPVHFLVSGATPLDEVAVNLRVLVPTRVAATLQGDATAGTAAPGAQLLARLRPGPGARNGGGHTYHVRLQADAGAAPADLEGGDDERFLGVLLQLVRIPR